MSGKEYSGEKAVISLTSWKKRIDKVGLTLFSLVKQCPGFHIVLVLSEEEFPKKEAELPASLMAFVNAKMIEILWVFENTKSFKKVLPTITKYSTIPVISLDDDCIILRNYAEHLYQMHKIYQNSMIYISSGGGTGYGCLFPAGVYKNAYGLVDSEMVSTNNDDAYYYALSIKHNINRVYCNVNKHEFIQFHDSIEPLNTGFKERNVLNEHLMLMRQKLGV